MPLPIVDTSTRQCPSQPSHTQPRFLMLSSWSLAALSFQVYVQLLPDRETNSVSRPTEHSWSLVVFMCAPMTAQRSVLPRGMPQALLVSEAHSHSQMGEVCSALYGEGVGGRNRRAKE